MGNNACCATADLLEIDSPEERYIRETIKEFSSSLISSEDFEKVCSECFGLQLIEIEGDPLEWVTNDSYDKFISQIYPKKKSHPEILKYMKLPYGKIEVSQKEYKGNYHLLLLMWIIGITKEKTISKKDKKELIKQIINKATKVITFNNFFKFLFTFFEIMLVEVTMNFRDYNYKEISGLVTQTYNVQNINTYVENLRNGMFEIIRENKKQITKSTIQNDFINDELLEKFFEKYKFLLDVIELRDDFYNHFSSRGAFRPTKDDI